MVRQNMHILAIDQGTTSSRAIIFNKDGKPLYIAQNEFAQHYPNNGWVEHAPEALWETTYNACVSVLAKAKKAHKTIVAIGITNQRETTIVWDKATGNAIYPAIVWQDRRTADWCATLRNEGMETTITQKTGLLLDPYFSATKLAWILENVSGARDKANQGKLAFGTVDSYLLWRLTGGKVHATDVTNASRTMLFNIHTLQWDKELLRLFNIPEAILPEVKECTADYGVTVPELFGQAIPIAGIAGDQQAATIGQGCFSPGMAKSTYGTGCFVMLNTGKKPVKSQHRLLTTIAYSASNEVTYALEGSIFSAGSAVQWLRDGLKIIKKSAETESLARSVADNHGVYMVPAFTGLGAPHWRPDVRGTIVGITRDTGPAQLVRATLESIVYQTDDLLQAMASDGSPLKELRVDGGMVANTWFVQFLADILNIPVIRPIVHETTALGAAYVAGLQVGLYSSLQDIASHWQQDKVFTPQMEVATRQNLRQGWHEAVMRLCGNIQQ